MIQRFLPFLDLRELDRAALIRDVFAAVGLVFLAVPQGVAYAMIAGLPPAMGLYAAAIPTVVGSLFRSSRHVVSGPTNAISLLVGGAVAVGTGDPVAAAVTIAFTVGLLQFGAGVLNLGSMVDYISSAVVLGYITGAGVLIGVGQLPNITHTPMERGHIVHRLQSWLQGIGEAHMPSVALALASIAALLLLKRFAPKTPGTVVVMGAGIALSYALDLGASGMTLVRDLAPVPAGLPPLTLPDLSRMDELLSVSLAATLLSLVESSAVGRSIASRSGQTLDTSVDFAGQGLANIAAAFTGGYPVSGSLSRSAMNERSGASSRLSGTLSGVLMLAVLLLFGPVVNWTPVPVLAGILVVIAVNLVDVPRLREALAHNAGDSLAFLATVIGTWVLPLDRAILLGVGISIALFLRRVRHLHISELVVDDAGVLREVGPGTEARRSPSIKILHVEGNLFFGAANDLQSELDHAYRDTDVKVLVVRLKRAQGLDLTSAAVLLATHNAMEKEGRTLLLVGLRPRTMELLERTGFSEAFGRQDIFPTESGWFVAMDHALERALELADSPDTCPVRAYLDQRHAQAAAS